MFNRKTESRAGELQAGGPAPPPLMPNGVGAEPPLVTTSAGSGEDASQGLAEAAQSVIGKDLSIEGQAITIRCKGALHVNGNIEAEVHSKELTVGQFGTVSGSIVADSVDVWGRVSGAIRGTRVVLHASADVEGDIHAKSLKVEDGATFEGRSRRVTDPATIAPQLEPGVGSRPPEAIPLPPGTARPH